MHKQHEGDFRDILTHLVDAKVDFILVGSLSALLQGVGLSTLDVEIVHSQEPENLQRLLASLDLMNAQLREKQTAPTMEDLIHLGHLSLSTDFGSLDLRTSDNGLNFEELLGRSDSGTWRDGKPIRLLKVEITKPEYTLLDSGGFEGFKFGMTKEQFDSKAGDEALPLESGDIDWSILQWFGNEQLLLGFSKSGRLAAVCSDRVEFAGSNLMAADVIQLIDEFGEPNHMSAEVMIWYERGLIIEINKNGLPKRVVAIQIIE